MSQVPSTAREAAALLSVLYPPDVLVEGRSGGVRHGARFPIVSPDSTLLGAYVMRSPAGYLVAGPDQWAGVLGTAHPEWLAAFELPAVLVPATAPLLADAANAEEAPGEPINGRASTERRPRVAVLDLTTARSTPKGAAALTASVLTAEAVAADLALWAEEGRASEHRPRASEAAAVTRYAEAGTALLAGAFEPWLEARLAEIDPPEPEPVEAFPTVPAQMRGTARLGAIREEGTPS